MPCRHDDAIVRDGRLVPIVIRHEPLESLDEYARIPIAFYVRERLRIGDPEELIRTQSLSADALDAPWRKDYDALEPPTSWRWRFERSPWVILGAWQDDVRVGGAVVIQEEHDVATLWDIRVAPTARAQGIGAALFRAAESWATSSGASWLEVETQDINLPACRFYARRGCTLTAVNPGVYPALPGETQLLWRKRLR